MNHFGTALTEIINRNYKGNRSTLAEATGVSPSTITRFCKGEVDPTLDRLESICACLNRHDRKQLLLSAARDRVPPIYQNELFGDEDPASQLLRARLSPDLAAVIRFLESNAMADELTASYLRRIGQWVGIGESQLKVAEDAQPTAQNPTSSKKSVNYRDADRKAK